MSAIEILVNKILENMERCHYLPWDSGIGKHEALVARNYDSRRRYSGINALILNLTANGTREFATWESIKKAGAKVNKGAKAHYALFVKFPKKDKKEDSEEKTEEEIEEKKKQNRGIQRFYKVYEICDTTLPSKIKPAEEFKNTPIEEIEKFCKSFIEKTDLELVNFCDTACYYPSQHKIRIPELKNYKTEEDYYSTLFHEMVHSTGSKMGRTVSNGFGSEKYSEEEIVAEVGAMLLCQYFGIAKAPRDNSVTYLDGWGKNIRSNPKWLMTGAAKAEKAVRYMLETCGLDTSIWN